MFCGKQQDLSLNEDISHLASLAPPDICVRKTYTWGDLVFLAWAEVLYPMMCKKWKKSIVISSTWHLNKKKTAVPLEQNRFHCFFQWVREILVSGDGLCIWKNIAQGQEQTYFWNALFSELCKGKTWNWFLCLHSFRPWVSLSFFPCLFGLNYYNLVKWFACRNTTSTVFNN